MVERTAFTIAEFIERNGIGLTKAYDEIKAGRLKAHKLGRRTLVFAEHEQAWRDALPALSPKNLEAAT